MSKIIVRRQEYANNGTHANEIEAVVKQNLIVNTLSSALDVAPSVGLLKSVSDAFVPINVSTIYTRNSDNTSGVSAIIYKTGNVVQVGVNTDLQSIASLQNKTIGHISNYRPVDITPFVGLLIKNRSSAASEVFAVPMGLTTNGDIVCSNIGGFGHIGEVSTSSRLIFGFTYITT